MIRAKIQLHADPAALHGQYVNARPFPHIVIDNLFDSELLERVLAEFPQPDQIAWRRFENDKEKKLGYWHESDLPPDLLEVNVAFGSKVAVWTARAVSSGPVGIQVLVEGSNNSASERGPPSEML